MLTLARPASRCHGPGVPIHPGNWTADILARTGGKLKHAPQDEGHRFSCPCAQCSTQPSASLRYIIGCCSALPCGRLIMGWLPQRAAAKCRSAAGSRNRGARCFRMRIWRRSAVWKSRHCISRCDHGRCRSHSPCPLRRYPHRNHFHHCYCHRQLHFPAQRSY